MAYVFLLGVRVKWVYWTRETGTVLFIFEPNALRSSFPLFSLSKFSSKAICSKETLEMLPFQYTRGANKQKHHSVVANVTINWTIAQNTF